ncbi:MAG: hypothetical protein QG597_268, partial [Actinomycetota bacterium]|nr:hypothetical protein [Actinomycetota bacterium]
TSVLLLLGLTRCGFTVNRLTPASAQLELHEEDLPEQALRYWESAISSLVDPSGAATIRITATTADVGR